MDNNQNNNTNTQPEVTPVQTEAIVQGEPATIQNSVNPGMPNQTQYSGEPVKKKSGLATASMILGIVSSAITLIPILDYLCFILGLLATIFAIVSFCKKAGVGKAIAGIILGILSFIMPLIYTLAISAVDTTMDNARLNALGTEGLAMIEGAITAYQAEILKGSSASFKSSDDVCFDMQYLYEKGFFEKSELDNYTGSVLVEYNNGEYNYSFWLSNGTYVFGQNNGAGVLESNYNDIDNEDVVTTGTTASANCGNKTGVIYCTNGSCY